jgi:uncharacterized membrane protein HdeD (DUF308 family)
MAPIRSWTIVANVLGIFGVVNGLAAIGAAFRARQAQKRFGVEPVGSRWGHLLAEGVIALILGILCFVWPAAAAGALYALVSAWAFVTGGAQLASAIRNRHVLDHAFWLGLSGAMALLLGVFLAVLMVRAPLAGFVTLAFGVGAYAVILGTSQLVLAAQLRARLPLRRPVERRVPQLGAPQPTGA